VRVLVDGRVNGADGIGRYTRCVVKAVTRLDAAVDIRVLERSGTHRYSLAAGAELVAEARDYDADLIHALDYRIPVTRAPAAPMVITVHDVLRLTHPTYCYSDQDFEARFGEQGLTDLRAAVSDLRDLAALPAQRTPISAHDEFLGRMLALAVARAQAVVTPTAAVARELQRVIPAAAIKARISPWGVDHLPAPAGTVAVPRPYLLYVGQARPHKGLPALLDAVGRTAVYRAGAHLVLAGRDFTSDSAATVQARDTLDAPRVHPLGEVTDRLLALLYVHAIALLHLAAHEGFGFPPLEALAAGCPVVASDIPALRETLGDMAAFADPHDPGDVADRLRGLLAADSGAARAERTRWASKFRWDRHAADLLTCYQSAVHGR
jgi:glycosyltransferase involved in cell wall biosynthesis